MPSRRIDLAGMVWAAAALTAAVGAALFLIRSSFQVFYPYLLNLGEPALAQSVRYMGLGIWPYHDLSQPPFSVVPYGPVYLMLSAAAQQLLGPALPMAGGRLVCLIASFAAAGCIGLITLRSAASRRAALAAGAFFLCLPFAQRWGVQVNVDMTGVALELAALTGFFYYAASGHARRRYFWMGTAFAVAAAFTKSSAIAAAVAWAFYLLIGRRWRDLALYAAVGGGSVIVTYAALNAATSGQYYWHTTHEIGHRLFFAQFIPAFWKTTVIRHPLNAAAALIVLALPVFWRSRPTAEADSKQASAGTLLNLYLLLTLVMTVSLGKQGSDTNYMLPFLAASTLAIGRFCAPGAKGIRRAAAALAAAGIIAGALPGAMVFDLNTFKKGMEEKAAFYANISKAIQPFADPIISWDMTLLIANDRPVYFEPFPMAQAGYSGVWDQTPILEDLKAGRINLIITYFWSQVVRADRNFTPEFVQALRDHYQLAGRVRIPWDKNSILFFYVPKKSQAQAVV